MATEALVAIKGHRLSESLLTMARIGITARGGVTRLALTDEDLEARALFRHWLVEAGLDVRFDDFGNIYGWRSGRDASLPPVLLGSHLDTVRGGGKFDGALGALAALEVVRTFNNLGIDTRRTIGVVNFTAEEGSRFEPAILGSGALTGRFSKEFVYSRRARDNQRTYDEELTRIAYKGEPQDRSPRPHAFLELHIEQGPILEREGFQIGVVEGIVGLVWFQVTLEGQASHAGPTPMAERKDALVGAARVVQGVRDLARLMGPDVVATVGRLKVEPDVINVIPGRVTLSVDLRHSDSAKLEAGMPMVRRLTELIANDEGLVSTVEEIGHQPVTKFSDDVVQAIEWAARDLDYRCLRMTSGAGHDSQWMAHFCPTGMIFVPTVRGMSHCEEEDIGQDDAIRGATALANAALRLAQS